MRRIRAYIYSKATSKKTKNRLGLNLMLFPMDRLETADIDDMAIFLAEFLLLRKLQNEK